MVFFNDLLLSNFYCHERREGHRNYPKQKTFPKAIVARVTCANGKPVRVLSARVDLSRAPAGLDVSVTPRSLDDGSVELRAYVADPLPLKAGGLFGKITVVLDSADEKELVIDLLGLIRIGGPKR